MKSADISFCLGLIGKPWVSGASGPEAFDCWGLLRHVYAARRGWELPQYPGVSESGRLSMVRNAEAEALARWQPVTGPAHFALVAMSESKRIHHVGLWLDEGGGGILHSSQGRGVLFQSPASVRQSGLQNFTFYQYRP